MNFPEKIEGQKITLERAKATFELANELFALVENSRENLLPWLPWALKNKTPEDEFDYLLNWCQKNWKEEKGYAYVIRENTSGHLVGSIDFFKTDNMHKNGEIGYWLDIEYIGKGYMSEAVKLLETEVFNQGFNRIVISNDTRNLRSANVAERAGYHLDGILRQASWSESENCFVDTNVWSKIKADLSD